MSVTITVDTEGEDIVVYARRVKERTKQLVLKLAADVKATAFLLAPKRTGRLAESIRVVELPGEIEVVVEAPYAAKVERDAGFFYRAISETEDRIPAYLREIEIGV